MQVKSKSSRTSFETIFKTLSFLGPAKRPFWLVGIQENISTSIFYFLTTFYWVIVVYIKILIMSALVTLANRFKVLFGAAFGKWKCFLFWKITFRNFSFNFLPRRDFRDKSLKWKNSRFFLPAELSTLNVKHNYIPNYMINKIEWWWEMKHYKYHGSFR